MKKCGACGSAKPLEEFHRDRSKPDGLNHYCKPCTRERQRRFAARPPRRKDPEGFRTCSRCKTLKPLDDYFNDAKRSDGKARTCKPCATDQAESWRKRNLSKANSFQRSYYQRYPEKYRDYWMKQLYGLPHGTYAAMLAAQHGRCAICESEQAGGKGGFHLDHCHNTGVVRGLLCHNCNTALGKLKDNVKTLEAAISYLQRPRLLTEGVVSRR